VAYYDHRHSGIDKTNILQVVKAVEGKTILLRSKDLQCDVSTRKEEFTTFFSSGYMSDTQQLFVHV
jgi:hypothetical protein